MSEAKYLKDSNARLVRRIAELEANLISDAHELKAALARIAMLEAENASIDKFVDERERMQARIAELEANAQHAPSWQMVHKLEAVHELEAERDNAEIAYDELKIAYNDVFAQLRRAESELDRLKTLLGE